MLRAELRGEAELTPQLRRLLVTLLCVVYREHCCRFSDEDCDDLADLAYRYLQVDLDSECEEGG